MTATRLDGQGVAAAVTAYAMWGLFPAFWPLLAPAAPVEVLAHRIQAQQLNRPAAGQDAGPVHSHATHERRGQGRQQPVRAAVVTT